ncbi:MAG TPA: hypothetical protein VGB37_16265, partial [Candidatus Lokiarchaeia archaeon]
INNAEASTVSSTGAYFLVQSTNNQYYRILGSNLPATKTYSTYSSTWVKSNGLTSYSDLHVFTHNLNANFSDIITKVFFSTVGSDTSCFSVDHGITFSLTGYNFVAESVSTDVLNAINLRFSVNGLLKIVSTGYQAITSTVWMKVTCYKF